MKEYQKIVVEKWKNTLGLEEISYNCARLLENISLSNSTDVKFLLSTALRLMSSTDIQVLKRKKNPTKIQLLNIEEESIYDNGVIMIDSAIAISQTLCKAILTKLPEDKKISTIEVERGDGILSFSLVI